MATYRVFSRARPLDMAAAAEGRVVFVREAFSWLALFFAPLVLLFHRLWLVLAAYVAVSLLLALALDAAGTPEASVEVVMIGLNLLIAFELSDLRACKLTSQGYMEDAVVVAPGRDIAEQRFFAAWTPRRPASPEALTPRPGRGNAEPSKAIPPLGAAEPSVIGAFPGN